VLSKLWFQVHIRCSFNRPPSSAGGDLESGKQQDSDDDFAEDEAPNEVVINVIQAKGLLAVDKPVFGPSSSDPFVRIKIDGCDTQKTKYIRKNLAPVWNTTLTFPFVTDPSLSLEITVDDHNDITTHTFLGKAIIPLQKYDDKKPVKKWFALKNKLGELDKEKRGEIELMIHWRFNAQVKEEARKKQEKQDRSALGQFSRGISNVGKVLGAVEESDDEAEDDDVRVIFAYVLFGSYCELL